MVVIAGTVLAITGLWFKDAGLILVAADVANVTMSALAARSIGGN